MKPNTAIVLVEGFEGLGLSWLGACLDAQSPGFNPQHCIHACVFQLSGDRVGGEGVQTTRSSRPTRDTCNTIYNNNNKK